MEASFLTPDLSLGPLPMGPRDLFPLNPGVSLSLVGPVLPVPGAHREWGVQPFKPESKVWGALGCPSMAESEYQGWIPYEAGKMISRERVLLIEDSVLLSHTAIFGFANIALRGQLESGDWVSKARTSC